MFCPKGIKHVRIKAGNHQLQRALSSNQHFFITTVVLTCARQDISFFPLLFAAPISLQFIEPLFFAVAFRLPVLIFNFFFLFFVCVVMLSLQYENEANLFGWGRKGLTRPAWSDVNGKVSVRSNRGFFFFYQWWEGLHNFCLRLPNVLPPAFRSLSPWFFPILYIRISIFLLHILLVLCFLFCRCLFYSCHCMSVLFCVLSFVLFLSPPPPPPLPLSLSRSDASQQGELWPSTSWLGVARRLVYQPRTQVSHSLHQKIFTKILP